MQERMVQRCAATGLETIDDSPKIRANKLRWTLHLVIPRLPLEAPRLDSCVLCVERDDGERVSRNQNVPQLHDGSL